MWTPIAFLVILAAAASAEYGFKVGSEYKYEVTSKTLTSLQQVSQQYSGVFIRAQLTVQPVKEDELIAYISQPEKAQIHTTFPGGVEFNVPSDVVQYTSFTLSKEPFVIRLKNGIVDELVVSKDLPIWEVNIIRSIVSQLQVDTQGRRVIPSKLNSLPRGDEKTAVYKIMEDTVEGECEVLYDVSPLPKYILQSMPYLAPQYQVKSGQEELIDIMKTKNFSNCEQRPGYHFGLNGLTNWEPTTNKMGNFLSRSSVSRVVVSGSLKTYTIHSSVTTNKVILSPHIYNNQKGEVVSRVNLTLTSVQTASGQTQGPKNPQTLKKLVYDFNKPFTSDVQAREQWNNRQEQTIFKARGTTEGNTLVDQVRSKRTIDDRTMILSNKGWYQETPKMTEAPETPFLPYFVGYEGHCIQHSKEINVNQVVRKLAEQIGQHLQEQTHISKENVLDRFLVLTRVIRTMNVKQLEQSVQEIYTPEKENTQGVSDTPRNTWMAFRDALSQAGTGPALMTIVNLITTQKIKGEEAAQVVSTLPKNARYPTTEYMNTFFELVKKPEVLSQAGLNSSTINAFTTLVRLAIVSQKSVHSRYPVHAFGYLTQDESIVTETYIPYFAQQLEEAVRNEDSHKIQTHIRALTNIAHPKIVQVLEPYLEGKKPMTDFQRTLVVVSLNKLAMVHPKLARSVLYKIYANTGEVYQVRVAAVYNLMKTNPSGSMLQRMAQFTHEDPSYQVRSAVKSAIESAAVLISKSNQELRQNAQSAVNMVVPKVYGLQYSRENLTDYLVKGLHLGYTQYFEYIGSEDSLFPKVATYNIIGNRNGYKNAIFKVAGMISSVQGLQDLLKDIFVYDETEQVVGSSETKDQSMTLEKIRQILNIEHVLKEQVEGNFAFKFGTIHRFFAFDNHTIESLPQILNKFSQLLAKGKVYNYQKMFNEYQITLGLPTATGLPFVYTLKTPTYFGLKGKVQAEIPEIQMTQRGSQIPKAARFTSNIEFTYATTKKGEIGFVTPFDHQRYVAGYKRQVQVNIPVKGSFGVDVEKRHIQMEIKPAEKRGDYEYVYYSTKPYTAVQSVLEFKPITEGSNTKVIKTNVVREFKQQYGQKYLGMVVRLTGKTENRHFDLKKIIYDLTQRHNMVSVLLYPTAEHAIDNTEVSLTYDSQLSTAQTVSLTATYRTINSKEYQQHEGETEKVFVPTQESQTRVEKFYKQVSAGIKRATVSVVDLGLKVQGQTPIQYIGTVAYARSPIDAPTKVTAYLHKTVGGENYEVCFNGIVKDTYLSAVDFEKVVTAEPHSEVTAQLKFGQQCESGAKVELTGRLERSQERRQYLQTLPQVQNCKAEMQQGSKMLGGCRNATFEAGLMDKYRFTVKHHGVPETVKNMTYQVYSVLRHIGYPYVTESLVAQGETTQKEQIELDVNFSPDLKTANVYVSAPTGVAQFRNIKVGRYARSILVVHPVYNVIQRVGWNYLKQQYDAYCTVDKVQVKTFDNQTYSTHLGNVWHVMSISVPKVTVEGKYRKVLNFAVLVRDDSSNRKEVQFIFDYPQKTTVRIAPSQGQSHAAITVNEKPVTFDDKGYYEYQSGQHTVIKAYVLPTGEVKIVHPEHGFEIIYDVERVQLVLSQEYRNRVGGICGVYNGEHFNYVTPQGYILQNPEEFAATWALSTEGKIAELKKRAQEHSKYKKTVILTNVVGEQDTVKGDTYGRHETDPSHDYTNGYGTDETQDHQNECTTKRIMVIERDGKHCFSVHPQTTCKPGCQVEKTRTVTDDFICVNKTQTSTHWAQMVTRGAQPNFKNKGNTQKMQFEGPEVCTQ